MALLRCRRRIAGLLFNRPVNETTTTTQPGTTHGTPPRHVTRDDLRGVWAITWRTLLLGPVVVPLGYAVLIAWLASLVVPPLYAGICVYAGDYALGALTAAVWVAWLKFAPRWFKPLFGNWRDEGPGPWV